MKFLSCSIKKCLIAGTLALSIAPILVAQTRKPVASDQQILTQIEGVLHNEPAFEGMSIKPSVAHGIVSLNGYVTSQAAKVLASSEIANIDGIKTVLNNLNVEVNSARPVQSTAKVTPVIGASTSKTINLPAGTVIPVRIENELDTKTVKPNDTFHATTASNVVASGYTLIPTGTSVLGRVVEAKAAGHFTGFAELSIELVSLKLATGTGVQDVSIVTEALSSKASGRGTNTAEKTGGGAALGAIIGAMAGGGGGAAIGAVSGGALGAGANGVTRGKEIDLKPEQLLQFRISSPLDVTVKLRDGHQVPWTTTGPALEVRPTDPSTAMPSVAEPQQ